MVEVGFQLNFVVKVEVRVGFVVAVVGEVEVVFVVEVKFLVEEHLMKDRKSTRLNSSH